MQRVPVITNDGSHTISIPERKLTYHSMHGAFRESQHVFIEAGFNHVLKNATINKTISVLEVGFGTGLNALLTLAAAKECKQTVHYTALEPFPLGPEEVRNLNYGGFVPQKKLYNDFLRMHEEGWNQNITVSENFILQKVKITWQEFEHNCFFDLVYYDAFAPLAQPELWTRKVFEKLHTMMQPGGVLVTYCSKGDVRRAMLAAGFCVEKLPGPPGKREMMRAVKKG